jgi:hypothetical protein
MYERPGRCSPGTCTPQSWWDPHQSRSCTLAPWPRGPWQQVRPPPPHQSPSHLPCLQRAQVHVSTPAGLRGQTRTLSSRRPLGGVLHVAPHIYSCISRPFRASPRPRKHGFGLATPAHCWFLQTFASEANLAKMQGPFWKKNHTVFVVTSLQQQDCQHLKTHSSETRETMCFESCIICGASSAVHRVRCIKCDASAAVHQVRCIKCGASSAPTPPPPVPRTSMQRARMARGNRRACLHCV